MTRATLEALLAHWWRQPLQLVTLLTGLALATGLWSAVQAINSEARASYARAAAQIGDLGLAELVSPTGSIPVDRYVALRRAGWQVSPVLEGRLRLGTVRVTVIGVDPLTAPAMPALERADIEPAALLSGPGRLFARPETAHALRDAPDLPPMIETDAVPQGVILTDIAVAARLLDRPDQISRLRIAARQPAGLAPLAEVAPDLTRIEPTGTSDIARLTDSFHLNLMAFGLLSFAVGLFIVHGAVGLAFEQRRPLFRTLRALGVPANRLTALVLAELLGLALVAGAIGLVLGYLVAAALLPGVAATLRGLYGATIDGGLTLRPVWVAGGLGMAILGVLVASSQGLWRLMHMPILSGPGIRAWANASRRAAWWQTGAGLMLMVLGGLSMLVFDGLVAGFALLGGVLMGAALLLPPVLGLILRFGASYAKGPIAQWVWADMRAQLSGLSLALMALLLALAANIGVSTMVSSFRLTFVGWLDQRLASELYVTATSDAQGIALQAWLQSRADAVLPIRATDTEIAGIPAQVFGVIDHATYRDNWPLLQARPDAWTLVAQGTGVLVSEQLARRAGLWTGQSAPLAPGWNLPVVGVYSDYGNPAGQAIVSLDALLAQAPDIANRRFGVRVAPDQAARLDAELRAAFDLPLAATIPQAELKRQSLAVFDKTFVVSGALNVLTLGVAAVAILTSLLTLWTTRLPQLAPVWALGVPRRHLARLDMARSLLLAALTALLALPLGLVLAWVLLAVINVEAFGWRLPMFLFPLDWLRLFVFALLAAGLAAAWPARRLRNVPPSDLLKVFANER